MCRVLLVDDEVALTRIVRLRLERAGFEVEVINRPFGVLNLIAASRPSVVVMDLNMPGLMGSELVALLREDPDLSDTRVVFYSGIAKCQLQAQARAVGADGFAHKMSDFSHLLRAIRTACVELSPASVSS